MYRYRYRTKEINKHSVFLSFIRGGNNQKFETKPVLGIRDIFCADPDPDTRILTSS